MDSQRGGWKRGKGLKRCRHLDDDGKHGDRERKGEGRPTSPPRGEGERAPRENQTRLLPLLPEGYVRKDGQTGQRERVLRGRVYYEEKGRPVKKGRKGVHVRGRTSGKYQPQR